MLLSAPTRTVEKNLDHADTLEQITTKIFYDTQSHQANMQ